MNKIRKILASRISKIGQTRIFEAKQNQWRFTGDNLVSIVESSIQLSDDGLGVNDFTNVIADEISISDTSVTLYSIVHSLNSQLTLKSSVQQVLSLPYKSRLFVVSKGLYPEIIGAKSIEINFEINIADYFCFWTSSSDQNQIIPQISEYPDFLLVENASISFIDIPFLIEQLQISENQFNALEEKNVKVNGRNYADHYVEIENLRTHDTLHQNRIDKSRFYKKQQIESSEAISRKQKTPVSPSIWDLLFALLQPPLDLDTGTAPLLHGHKLYPYQVQGVKFLIENKSALLADEMGTGKTVMTICALKILIQQAKIHHVLILCPPTIIMEWEKHLQEWAPELRTVTVKATADIRMMLWKTQHHVYITSYDTFTREFQDKSFERTYAKFFDAIVIDEAHHIRNPKTKRFAAIKKIKSAYRWALTGTPIQNNLEELKTIFDFLIPGYIKPFYLLNIELVREVIKPFFLRRRKVDVLADLPPKQRQEFWLELNEKQKEEYQIAERDVQFQIREILTGVSRQDRDWAIKKGRVITQLSRLKQICNFPSGSLDSPKLSILKDQLEDIIESGNKVIVFSHYIQEGIDKLEKALQACKYQIARLDGRLSAQARRRQVELFKYSNHVPVLLASIKAGGEGLNLTEASYVIHFDHWWNPATMWQAEDRVHRRGQTKGVNIFSYWMKDTIEERIYRILERKARLFEKAIDSLSEKQIDESLTIEDLLYLAGLTSESQAYETPKKSTEQNQNIEEIIALRNQLHELSPEQFEYLTKIVLERMGYQNVLLTSRSRDGGIDLTCTTLVDGKIEKVAVECKRYKGSVNVQKARELFGAISSVPDITKALLITTGEFTSDCLNFCYRNNIRPISGLELAKYVLQYGIDITKIGS